MAFPTGTRDPNLVEGQHAPRVRTEFSLRTVGWHTFRHTYRTFLGELKAPLEVQKALMRQADISTTLKYGQSSMENQRTANTMVVREILIRRSQK